MNYSETDLKPNTERILELEQIVRAQRDEIVRLRNEIKVLDDGPWVSEACGDDLWEVVLSASG
ncbi:hypothetical protein [uncultured Roseobacter sp.]|uniref:hypothetical protein n=1 Tax=uncultured Roseobacter sp. TaxID=114847 RepID=UPI0026145F8A|nr:hypothetical protein [uncultured Roseobacter sp.]